MPWPASVTLGSGSVPIDPNFTVSLTGAGASDPRVQAVALRLFDRLYRQTGIKVLPRLTPAGTPATLTILVENKDHRPPQKLGDDERYSLIAADNHIRLSANGPLGALRGVETFLQLITPSFSVPAINIQDSPRFPWRGLSLDVSRHFIPVDGVKRTIDGLAAVKMNVFHWHLSDDQGFRIESKKFPRLQQLGSDGMYYTQAQVVDVINYARARGIRVIPEFDIPGHATSWLPGYPKLGTTAGPFDIVRTHGILTALLDPTKESTYRFLDTFIGEMTRLFPDDYFHIGGDEVNPKEWNESASVQAFMRKHNLATPDALQSYFNARLLKIVTKHGKRMEGWDEILQPNLPKTIVIQSWRGQESLWQAAREGFQGILSAGYYVDLMYPASQHYAVDPMVLPPAVVEKLTKAGKPIPEALTPEQAKNVLGGEAAMWEELATDENLDAKLWPRTAAIAERFWSAQSVTDPRSMYDRLEKTNHWLEYLGLTQQSNLVLMRRQLLKDDRDLSTLDRFAAVLEPVKGYSRHAEKYGTYTPLNRLVDAIPPESNTARHFREAVDTYLTNGNPEAIRTELASFRESARNVRPVLHASPILTENLEAAEALDTLSRIGEEALTYRSAPAPGTWKADSQAAVKSASQHKGDLLVQIAPGVQKLVDSVTNK